MEGRDNPRCHITAKAMAWCCAVSSGVGVFSTLWLLAFAGFSESNSDQQRNLLIASGATAGFSAITACGAVAAKCYHNLAP